MKKSHNSNFLIGLVFSLAILPGSIRANPDAIAVVEEFHSLLIEVMQQAEELGFQGRYDILEAAIATNFDMTTISNVVLSRTWRGLEAQQQDQFKDLFLKLSTATYASRFDAYNDQQFTTEGVDELNAGRLLVKTEISGDSMDTVRLDYILHQQDGRWKIISAIADGVNDLALKRAEYSSIISDDGFDGLITELQVMVTELGATP